MRALEVFFVIFGALVVLFFLVALAVFFVGGVIAWWEDMDVGD